MSGFVLAGGKSSRMGRDKARLEIGGVSLMSRAVGLLQSVTGNSVIISSSPLHELSGSRIVADDFPDWGPLGGIATALRISETDWSLVIACDLPYLTKAWLDFLIERALKSGADAVVPMNLQRPGATLRGVSQKRAAADSRGGRGRSPQSDGIV